MQDYSQIYAQTYASRPLIRLPRLLPWATVLVGEHEFALFYRHGRLSGLLAAGLHRLWGRHLQVVRLDRRRQLLEVPAQELQTADGVTIKVTAQVVWQITDPLAVITRDADHRQTVYAAVQQAIRAAVASHTLAMIGAQRAAIATAMREGVVAAVAAIGLVVHEAVLKDVMPNAETRKAMAALEKARGEQAALRALSNAARLMKDQPELAQIRSLQVLAEGLRNGASVVVHAGDAGLVPVQGRS